MKRGRLAITAAIVAVVVGCGGPGLVGPRAYEHAQALYALANRQAGDRVDALAETINADAANGALSDHETDLLTAVLDDARAGKWQAAAQAARRIMEDQVER